MVFALSFFYLETKPGIQLKGISELVEIKDDVLDIQGVL